MWPEPAMAKTNRNITRWYLSRVSTTTTTNNNIKHQQTKIYVIIKSLKAHFCIYIQWNIRYFHSINGHINHSSAQALPANGNLRLEFIFGILGAYHSIYNCMLYSIWWRRRVFGYNSTYSFIYLFIYVGIDVLFGLVVSNRMFACLVNNAFCLRCRK